MKKTLACAVASLIASGCFSGYSDDAPERQDLRVRRDAFHHEMILSGELEAARGELLAVPPLPSWQTSIKWIAEDGVMVRAGEPVVELDNGSLTAELDSKRQTAMQALQELQQREAEWAADLEQKQLEVEKKRADVEKADIDALVPRELLSGRAYEEKQGAVRRSATELEKARESLRSRQTAVNAERQNLQLNIEKTRREISIAEQSIDALVLRAPRDGIVVVKDIPWENRKLQAGDPVWVGFPLALLPELDSMRVTAVLPDVDDGKIAINMPVTVTLDGYPQMQFQGKISSIAAVAQESRRQSLRRHFEVLIALDRLDLDRMRPGLSARAVVHRGAVAKSLLAPRAALDFSSKSPRVKLANGEMKDVKLGPCNALECVVTSGLVEGDRLAHIVEVNG
jgi:multidrug resistance efflux pump